MPDRYIPQVSRRAVLRGLGATLALPFLPSLAWADDPRDPALPPRRFVTLTMGDGINPEPWWVRGQGASMELGPTLAPLAAHREQLTVLRNLTHSRKMGRVHGYHFTTFLNTAYAPSGRIEAATSIDQLIAGEFGRHTPIPSLVMGVQPVRAGMVNGAPSIYQATCSWSSPTTPIPPEILPREAFRRLFDVSSLMGDRSVLDYVLESSNDLRRDLGTTDRRKLDNYLDSVREIEQRIERAVSDEPRAGWQPTLAEPDMDMPPEGLPESHVDHTRLMLDILVLALRMDKTRVANFILNQDFSSQRYDFLDGVGRDNSHAISHHQNNPEKVGEYQLINRHLVGQAAYLCDRLAEIDEGHDTTLLDNTLIVFGSCFKDGDQHVREDLPILLLGGRSHGLVQGREVTFEREDDQQLGNLWLTLGQSMGLELEQFGNSVHRVDGIFAS